MKKESSLKLMWKRAIDSEHIRRKYGRFNIKPLTCRLAVSTILVALFVLAGLVGILSGKGVNGLCCLLIAVWLYGYREVTAKSPNSREAYLKNTYKVTRCVAKCLAALSVLIILVSIVAAFLVDKSTAITRQYPFVQGLAEKWIDLLNGLLSSIS